MTDAATELDPIDNLYDANQELRTEVKRLRDLLRQGQALINDMDLRMPEQATEDQDGWIISYRIPVGPWHRILGWCRGAVQARID
jgi:hypothetical protein